MEIENNNGNGNGHDRSDYLSVTTVLQPFSGVDKIPAYILAKAAERGDAVHKMIQGDLEGVGYFCLPEYQGYMKSYEKVKNRIQSIKHIEKRYYEDDMKVKGKIDLICLFDGKPTVLDWKTSAKESPTWQHQLSAYRHISFNLTSEIVAIRLDRLGGEPEVINYEYDLSVFQQCLHLYKIFFNNNKECYYESI